MAEYIKRDSIIGLANKLRFGRILTDREVEVVEMVVNSVHDDMRVDLVKCQECKWKPRNMGKGVEVENLGFPLDSNSNAVCPYASDDPWYNTEPDPNGFCSKGERERGDER